MTPAKMLRSRTPRAILLALTALTAPATAQQGYQHALPEDTLVFVGVDDVTSYSGDWAVSSIGRFWASPGMAPTRDRIHADLGGVRAMLVEELGVDPLTFPGMIEGGLAVALLDLDLPTQKGPDDVNVAVCLMADVGARADECRSMLEMLVDRFREEEPQTVVKHEDIGDVAVTCLMSPEEEVVPTAIRFGFHGTTLLAVLQHGALDRDPFLAVVDGLDGRADSVLDDAAAFRGSLAGGDRSGLRLYADLGRILNTVFEGVERTGDMDAEDATLVKQLGLRELGVMSMSMECGAERSVASMRVDWPGEGWVQRIMRHVCVPTEFPSLRYVAADVHSFTALSIDLGGVFDTVVRMLIELRTIEPTDVVHFLSEAETEVGFNPREDLLELLTGEFVFIRDQVDPAEALPFGMDDTTNYALIIGLEDGESFTTLVDGVIRKFGFHVGRKSEEFQGFTLYSVPLPVMPISLGYAITDDMCVLSLSPTMLRDVLRRKASPDLPSITGTEKYRVAVSGLGGRHGMLAFSDTATDMKVLVRTLGQLPTMLGEEFGPGRNPLAWLAQLPLPDESVIDEYFTGGTATTCRIDEQGVVFESVGP